MLNKDKKIDDIENKFWFILVVFVLVIIIVNFVNNIEHFRLVQLRWYRSTTDDGIFNKNSKWQSYCYRWGIKREFGKFN